MSFFTLSPSSKMTFLEEMSFFLLCQHIAQTLKNAAAD